MADQLWAVRVTRLDGSKVLYRSPETGKPFLFLSEGAARSVADMLNGEIFLISQSAVAVRVEIKEVDEEEK